MLRINDRVEGISVAPATPSSARVRISISGVVENDASNDAMPNPNAPINNNRRRPIRSPSDPIVIRNPAMRKP